MFEIAICDDSTMARRQLRMRVEKREVYKKIIRIHEYESGTALLEAMEDIIFSAIFLDIQMEGMDGNETAKRIRKIDSNLVLVFYTGFAEPSPISFEVQPYRYIMKNMSMGQMDEYIDAALRKMVDISKMPTLLANIGRQQVVLNIERIIYIEKYKRSTRIHITEQSYRLYGITADKEGNYPDIRMDGKLSDIYTKLKKYGFGCPHDSYIVNFNYLYACTAKTFKLAETAAEFQIARSKSKTFNELKDKFMCSKYVERSYEK